MAEASITKLISDSSNKLILVEDSASAPGRSFVLANAAWNDLADVGQDLKTNKTVYLNEVLAFENPTTGRLVRSSTDSVQRILEDLTAANQPQALFVHSLTPILIGSSLHETSKFLAFLKSNKSVTKIIATVHADCYSQSDVEVIGSLADVRVKVSSKNFDATELIKSSRNGKVTRSLVDIELDSSLSKIVKCSTTTRGSDKKKESVEVADENKASAVPISSFKLDLTEQEQQARSQVELPFWKQSKTASTKESTIEYIAEEEDDLDEEDPDDDLNF